MSTSLPGRLERSLLIALLAAFALVQPLLDLLGKQAEFLVAHALDGASLVWVVLGLSFGAPALVAALLALLVRLLPAFRQVWFNAFFVILCALTALPFLNSLPWPALLLVVLALASGVLLLFLFHRFDAVRLFFRVLTPAIIIFPLMFLFASRASPLVFAAHDSAAARGATIETSPDIIFLVLDEFPLLSLLDKDLNIDQQLFPNFARLAAISNWYPGATTGAEVTTYAVPEALTGRDADPGDQRLPISANYPDNLFSLLAGRYEMDVMETATHLCPREVCSRAGSPDTGAAFTASLASDLLVVYAHLVVPGAWALRLPSISDGWSGFLNRRPDAGSHDPGLEDALVKADLARQIDWQSRSVQFRHFIESIESGSRARLFYLHMLLPHRIWQYLPDGRQYLVSEVWEALDPPNLRAADLGNGRFGHTWQNDEWAVAVARQRHVLQVRFVDLLLGELLDRLEAQDMLASSVLVVTGDHGAGFVPGQPRRSITSANRVDVAAVPLFIKQAGQQAGRIVNGPARLTDILPTLREALRAGPDPALSGASLLGQQPLSRENVLVKHAGGGQLEYPFTQHMTLLAERARELSRAPDPAARIPGFAGLDVFSLLGRAPGDFSNRPSDGTIALIDAANLFESVNPQSDFVPAHIRGTLSGPGANANQLEKHPMLLAISVNGKITSISRNYRIAGFANRFEALLPPEALRAGNNHIQVFSVGTSSGAWVLQPLSANTSASNWALRAGQEGEQLVSGERSFTLQSTSGAGNVLSLPTESGSLFYLVGHAATSTAEEPRLVAFLDGQYAGAATIQDQIYSIAVAPGSARAASDTQVRVFAIFMRAGHAVELDYPAQCDPAWLFAAPLSWGASQCQLEPLPLFETGADTNSAVLNFGDPAIRPYLLDGWELEEGGISWTLGQSASMELPLPEGIGDLHFAASIKPFLHPPGLARQTLWLLANDQPVQSWPLESLQFEQIEWTLPSELLRLDPHKLKITFLLPDAASPAAIGAGEDIRILGMAVQQMTIREL